MYYQDIAINTNIIRERDSYEKLKVSNLSFNGMITEYLVTSDGRVYNRNRGTFLKQQIQNGFYRVTLYIGGKNYSVYVHSLVAHCFVKIQPRYINAGYSEKDLITVHLDGYKWHNYSYNLRYMTRAEFNRLSEPETLYTDTTKWKDILIDGNKTGYAISTNGWVLHKKKNRIQKPLPSESPYYRAGINYNSSHVALSPHRLVAEAFIDVPQELLDDGWTMATLQVNHKDGIKTHNNVSNLEWITPNGNMKHAIENDLCKNIQGENCHLAKMTEKQAIKCCEMLQAGMRSGDIAEKLGVSKKMVIHIKAGECWKHIAKNYTFPKSDCKPNTIPIEKIHELCKILEQKKYSDPEIAKMTGFKREYIRDIRLHKLQRKISKDYNF